MQTQPFKRAKLFFSVLSALNEAVLESNIVDVMNAKSKLQVLGTYRSRGKGEGTGNRSTKNKFKHMKIKRKSLKQHNVNKRRK